MKRKISKAQKEFLEQELAYLKAQKAVIEMEPLEEYYEVNKNQNNQAMHTLLWVGAVLVGVGFLTFIASNWSALSNLTKYFMIIIGIVGFYVAGWKTENKLPKTSRSLFYLGGFLFGAGIFLVGQTFHLGGAIYQAFFLWAMGIIPLAYYLKDKIILAFSIFLLFGYSTEIIFQGQYPFLLFAAIPAVYLLNHKVMSQSCIIFFLNSMLALFFVHTQLVYFNMNEYVIVAFIFIVGLLLSRIQFSYYKSLLEQLGVLIHGSYGIVLTIPEIWEYILSDSFSQVAAISFAIVYGLYIIFLVKQADLLAIVILCGLIFRFYIDISYDFLPKSLFFIIGGTILILFGFWFERSRRAEVNTDEKK
ncbi:MAG: DUF2157 domain-containing protein [Bacillus sp. (in: firmicutes)]